QILKYKTIQISLHFLGLLFFIVFPLFRTSLPQICSAIALNRLSKTFQLSGLNFSTSDNCFDSKHQFSLFTGSTDDLFVATNRSYIERNLNLLLLFCLLSIDDLSVATNQSSVVRKLDHLLLFCFVPIDGPSIATNGSSVRNKIYSFNINYFCVYIVHPWLVPTEQELQIPYSGFDKKKELAEATMIKKETPVVSGDADDIAIDVDANVGVDIGDVGAKSDGNHVDDVGGFCSSLAWYCNMYPTGKPSVATYESSGAADDPCVAINDLSVMTSFWFFSSFA
ncbi:hypothetical protein H5410_039107, partial [Solanum commersonii]